LLLACRVNLAHLQVYYIYVCVLPWEAPTFWGPRAAAQLDPPQGRAWKGGGVTMYYTTMHFAMLFNISKKRDRSLDLHASRASRRSRRGRRGRSQTLAAAPSIFLPSAAPPPERAAWKLERPVVKAAAWLLPPLLRWFGAGAAASSFGGS